MTARESPARPTPPPLFLVLDLPFGAAVGYLSIVLPFWMQGRGYGLTEIALVTAGANTAHAFKLLWVPLLDLGAYRKVWYLATCGTSAALFATMAAVPDPLGDLGLLAILLTLLQASAATAHAANNTLMATTTRPGDKGKVGGFAMASNIGGTGLLAWLALELAQRSSPRTAFLALAGVTVASALAALRIVEVRPVADAAARASGALARAGRHLASMARDLWSTLRSREGFTGLLICLAPVGCQAMTNLFSGVSSQYGLSEQARLVGAVNGLAGGLASAAGALVGGWLADRMNRRLAYALAGGMTGLCALAMALSPMTPATYGVGVIAYNLAGGIAFATWAGMVLEMVGLTAAAATKYALFNASLSFAITYVTFLDGSLGDAVARAAALPPARGALLVDAGLTFLGISALIAMVAVLRRAPRAAEPGPARPA
jgi:MFS family permease